MQRCPYFRVFFKRGSTVMCRLCSVPSDGQCSRLTLSSLLQNQRLHERPEAGGGEGEGTAGSRLQLRSDPPDSV